MNDEHTELYIGGRWVPATGNHVVVVDPFSEGTAGAFIGGSPRDVDAAVGAARRALPEWASLSPESRVEYLEALAAGIEARQNEFARVITAEMGAPLQHARRIQTGLPISILRSHRQVINQLPFESWVENSRVVKEPIGVVAAITPWNYPLYQIIAKLAAALTAGCTIIVKPSNEAPLSAYHLADVVHKSGLPAGVFNLVTGGRDEVGTALAVHDDVDMLSFTGSTTAGRMIARVASDRVRPIMLELGGKSPNLLLDDADLETAIKVGVANAFMNAGQTCSAWTRLLAPRSHKDDVLDLCRANVASYKVGDPREADTRMGPLASARQRTRVLEHIRAARAEGAQLICGGTERPHGLDHGFFVQPTVFAAVDPECRLAQEEVFGPVLAVIYYDTEEEALDIANSSIYGLAGAVWSSDEERATRVALRMNAGQVDVNGGTFNPLAPFGGYKQSGLGRELGTYGVEEYLQIKSIQY